MSPRIRKKVNKGHDYYSIVTSRRLPGKKNPQEIILEYIGNFEKLSEIVLADYDRRAREAAENAADTSPNDGAPDNVNITEAEPPEGGTEEIHDFSFTHYEYGASMAMYQMANLLGVEQIFETAFRKKTIHGLSRARVLLLSVINRAVYPCSESTFGPWVKTTALPYYLGHDVSSISSQDFCEAMDGITKEEIDAAQEMLVKNISKFLLTEEKQEELLRIFHLDYTNYYTFINSRNGQCIEPVFHWTDDKIHVHVFIGLVAIAVVETLRILLHNKDIDYSERKLMTELRNIHDGWIFDNYSTVQRCLQRLNPTQKQLLDAIWDICGSPPTKPGR